MNTTMSERINRKMRLNDKLNDSQSSISSSKMIPLTENDVEWKYFERRKKSNNKVRQEYVQDWKSFIHDTMEEDKMDANSDVWMPIKSPQTSKGDRLNQTFSTASTSFYSEKEDSILSKPPSILRSSTSTRTRLTIPPQSILESDASLKDRSLKFLPSPIIDQDEEKNEQSSLDFLSPIPLAKEPSLLIASDKQSSTKSSFSSQEKQQHRKEKSSDKSFLVSDTSLESSNQRNSNEMIAILRRRIAELERKAGDDAEQFNRLVSQQKSNEAQLADSLVVMQSHIETLQAEVEVSRQSAVEARSEKAKFEAQVMKLQASNSVLESRLDAAARRNIALESALRTMQDSNARLEETKSFVESESKCPICEELKEDLTHVQGMLEKAKGREQSLAITVRELESELESANWAKVSVDKRCAELDSHFHVLQHENKGLKDQLVKATHEQESLKLESEELKSQVDRANRRIKELERIARAHEARVVQSQANFSAKKLVEVVDSSIHDIESIVSLVESKLDGKRVNLDALLGMTAVDQQQQIGSENNHPLQLTDDHIGEEGQKGMSPPGTSRDVQILNRFSLLSERARMARGKAIDELARKSTFVNSSNIASSPSLNHSMMLSEGGGRGGNNRLTPTTTTNGGMHVSTQERCAMQ